MADSLPLYRQLAERLGGKLACTRPVFDRGLLPFKLVIGQSGAVVKPRLLFSFGVSGAVNHVTGIGDAETVVAVNKDPDAAIFHYCDYNDHRMAKSIEKSIDFAAKRQVWQ